MRRGESASPYWEVVGQAIVLNIVEESVDALGKALLEEIFPERELALRGWSDTAVAFANSDWIVELSRVACDERLIEKVFKRVVNELRLLLGLEEFSWVEGDESFEAFVVLSPWQYAGVNAIEELDGFSWSLQLLAGHRGTTSRPRDRRKTRHHPVCATFSRPAEVRAALIAGCHIWGRLGQRRDLDSFPSRHDLLSAVTSVKCVALCDLRARFTCESWWLKSWAQAEPKVLYGHQRGRSAIVYLPSVVSTWPDVDPRSLSELGAWAKENSFSFAEWRFEKIRIDSALEFQPRVQGLRFSLHERIVQALQQSGRAMTNKQLSRAICEDLRINPLTLPPGRILAYGRHPKFFSLEGAMFVLRDWVQTSSHRKGRIVPDRLLTPLADKEWKFGDELFGRCIAAHEPLIYLGLVFVAELALEIAIAMEDKPTDVYYLGLIRREIDKKLRSSATKLDSGIFAVGEIDGSVTNATEADIDLWMAHIAKRLSEVADPRVEDRLRLLLRRSRLLGAGA